MFCFRVKPAAWVTLYEPTLRAQHVKVCSAGRRSPRLVSGLHRVIWRVCDCHIGTRRSISLNVAAGPALVVELAGSVARSGAPTPAVPFPWETGDDDRLH